MARFSLPRRLLATILLGLLGACNDPAGLPDQPKASQSFIAVASTGIKVCGLTGTHVVYCWEPNAVPVKILTPEPLVTITGAYGAQFCGQTAAGTVYCWGALIEYNTRYTLGANENDPLKLGDGFLVGSLAVGKGHACAVAADSTAWCWGSYLSAKRGIAAPWTGPDLVPRQVSGGEHFSRLTAGLTHTCGIRGDGTVACWGDSTMIAAPAGPFQSWQACLESSACTAAPRQVRPMSGVYALASSYLHTCAIAANGLWCWGDNFFGELGVPGWERGRIAVQVRLPVAPVALTVGGVHTCALSFEGVAYCWGNNTAGELGVGDVDQRQGPAQVRFSGRFTQLAAGLNHTCGIDTKGHLYCWGDEYEESGAPWRGTTPVRLRVPRDPVETVPQPADRFPPEHGFGSQED